MTLYLSYENAQGNTKTVWLLPHQSLLVGHGTQCDLICDFDTQMSLQHFHIVHASDGWCLKPLGGQVLLNGRPITLNIQYLTDQCKVQAGNTEFRISIEGTQTQPTVEVAQVQPQPKQAAPLQWQKLSPVSVMVQWEVDRFDKLFKLLAQQGLAFAVINQMQLKQPVSGIALQGPDLFQEAPEEIRQTASLHLVPTQTADLSALTPSILSASAADGLLLMISDLPAEQLRAEMKILWAWFAKPSLFRFHMENGSKFLTQRLLAIPRCIILTDSQVKQRLIIFAAESKLPFVEQCLVELQN